MTNEYIVKLREVSLMVKGNYSPSEPMNFSCSNGDPGNPGSPSDFEIESIFLEGNSIDIYDLINGEDKEILKRTILEQLEN